MANKPPVLRIALPLAFTALVLVLVPTAFADKGGNGGGTGSAKNAGSANTGAASNTTVSANAAPATSSTCGTVPRASITNTYAWGASGSWGLPGQQLAYHVLVFNDDVGCSSSTFSISLSAPPGFSVSIPQRTITLGSSSSGYLWANVTSPAVSADGAYPLTLSTARPGTSSPVGISSSSYMLYSSDSVVPELYYANPWDGAVVSGRYYSVGIASSDDHAVKRIDLYIDGIYTSTSSCDNISYECQLSYKWATRRVHGQHTATFKSYDWMGNVGALTTTFTVN
ncbi:MAG: hypothetical protein ABI927_03425 [Gaiellaceae bacterium]